MLASLEPCSILKDNAPVQHLGCRTILTLSRHGHFRKSQPPESQTLAAGSERAPLAHINKYTATLNMADLEPINEANSLITKRYRVRYNDEGIDPSSRILTVLDKSASAKVWKAALYLESCLPSSGNWNEVAIDSLPGIQKVSVAF
jgi:hypothetical protein